MAQMQLEVARVYDDERFDAELIAQFATQQLANPFIEAIKQKWPDTKFVLRKLTLKNNPRWLIIWHGQKGPDNVAQFENQFKFLAESLVITLRNSIGPHFGMQEYKPNMPGIKKMAPDRKGRWHQVGEAELTQTETGIYVPKG